MSSSTSGSFGLSAVGLVSPGAGVASGAAASGSTGAGSGAGSSTVSALVSAAGASPLVLVLPFLVFF